MGKKDPEVMRNEEGRFVEGAVGSRASPRGGPGDLPADRQVRRLRLQPRPRRGIRAGRLCGGVAEDPLPAAFPGLAADRRSSAPATRRAQSPASAPAPRPAASPSIRRMCSGAAPKRPWKERVSATGWPRSNRWEAHRDGHRSGAAGVRRFRVPRPFPRIGGFPGPEPGRGGGAGLRRRARFRRRLAGPDPGSDSRRHRSGREGPRSAGGGGSDPCSAARTSGRRMCSARRRTGPRRNGCGGSARRSASTGRAIRQPNSARGSGKS